jgi:two-component system, NarL family, response regulator DesR
MIRVLLAEDEELIREALVSLLGREADLQVVATASDGSAAVTAALASRPDVAVVDLEMPRLDGLGVVTELGRVLPGCPVVILTGHGRPLVLRRALASGARGFLAKGAPGTALADVIRRVHEGHRYVDPVLAADALTAPPSPLTPREAEVLAGMAQGLTNAEIAARLVVGVETVRTHVAAVLRKLQARDRTQAVVTAYGTGLLEL